MNTRRLSASAASLVIHLLVIGLLLWSPFDAASPAASGAPPRDRTTIAVYSVEQPPPQPGESNEPRGDANDFLQGEEFSATDGRIPGFTFDVRKIVQRASSLFPFLTGTVELGELTKEPSAGQASPFASAAAPAQLRPNKPPLAISDEALQRVVDNAWSRRHRWESFRPIARLIERHDPDAGRLPALLRAYLEQNLLQPYVDTTIRDPRLWTMLGIAADNLDFIEFITDYTAQHPSTKTTTELLFLLDELVQGNLDTLAALLDTDPKRDMWWTRNESRNASDLLIAIWRHYDREVKRRGISTAGDLRAQFDQARLAVLRHVLRTTPDGYRANDARFLIGSIYWRQGRRHEAVSTWQAITCDPTDSYIAACAELVEVLGLGGDPTRPLLSGRINGVLAGENRRWAEFSKARLRQFGYAFDTF